MPTLPSWQDSIRLSKISIKPSRWGCWVNAGAILTVWSAVVCWYWMSRDGTQEEIDIVVWLLDAASVRYSWCVKHVELWTRVKVVVIIRLSRYLCYAQRCRKVVCWPLNKKDKTRSSQWTKYGEGKTSRFCCLPHSLVWDARCSLFMKVHAMVSYLLEFATQNHT